MDRRKRMGFIKWKYNIGKNERVYVCERESGFGNRLCYYK